MPGPTHPLSGPLAGLSQPRPPRDRASGSASPGGPVVRVKRLSAPGSLRRALGQPCPRARRCACTCAAGSPGATLCLICNTRAPRAGRVRRGTLALLRSPWSPQPWSCGCSKAGPVVPETSVIWCSERLSQTGESRALSRLVYMSQSKHTEARELMCSGALLFFSHGQQNSAADLSMLVLESLEKAEVEVAADLLENLAKLFSLMDPNSPERVAFVSRALKWSSGGSGKLGHPRLHQLLALTLWKEQNYCESRYHFLHSADGEGCAHMLVEYSTSRGFRSEVDMFVAQAVLQFLCLKNKSSASVVFTTYTQKHPSIENGPPFVQPLLNFIWFLLLAVDGGKLTVFTVLCEQYQPSLRRDPMYNEYLDRIGQLFFGVPPKQTSSYGGLLGNLLSSLMGASEQEGEDSQDDSSPIELD
ncbi:Golgi to ER traffic protein 4 homolog isoform X2 [Felis catus]|uniref:Guided entry of tail-anchored proteins factor 4 n=1 Tax=Felis catus TaxID=9685 RepID=A0ABI7W935_FELCA|nr:Golgi to ER traffic protein 4 homolog isoform X2 [Felis catus]